MGIPIKKIPGTNMTLSTFSPDPILTQDIAKY